MSQENVELHYRCLDAMNRRDLGAFLALMDDDVEAVSRIVAMEGGLHGHDGIRSWWENWFDVFPDYDIKVLEVRDLGDVTVAALRALGHGAASNLPFEDPIWQASRWRRGKVVWWRTFSTRDEALEAVGLSEQDDHEGDDARSRRHGRLGEWREFCIPADLVNSYPRFLLRGTY